MKNKKNETRVTWKCTECGDVVISYSHKRHEMDTCKCGATSVDMERWYSRFIGKIPIFLTTEEKIKNKWTKIINTGLVDWRFGKTPRQEVVDYFKSKGYLRTRIQDPIEGDRSITEYRIEYPVTEMGELIEELKETYDIMIRESFLAVDTKGYKFRQR